MLTRLVLAPLLLAAALALSGCDELCDQATKIGVFCPETPENKLNSPPDVDGGIRFQPVDTCPDHIPIRRMTTFGMRKVIDPDNDPLLYEWDLDGDGDYEAAGVNELGSTPSMVYYAPEVIDVRVRVSDFAYNLGAPGMLERTRRVIVVDPARNRPPQAAFTATAPIVAGTGVAFDAGATTDPDSYDVDGFAYQWDFGDGTFNPGPSVVATGLRTVTHIYREPGDYTVKLTVHDCHRGTDETELRVTVRPENPSDRAPVARFTATPASPFVGQPATLDGSSSTDPNGQIVRYEWDFDGNGTYERSGSEPTVARIFETVGEHVIGLRVTDDEGLVNAGVGSVTVRNNIPPTADFTVFPPTPFTGEDTDFDAFLSFDPDGSIVRYEWDFDGNGSFEVDAGTAKEVTTSYATPGERFVRLRVTDSAGATATTGRTILVRPRSGARAARVAPERAPVSFVARLEGEPVAAGVARRRGARRSLVGVVGRGSLRARVLAAPADTPAGVTRFLRAPWRTRVSFGFDRRSRRFTASGIALARAGGSAACLRIRLDGRPGRHPTGRLTLLGGRGTGAKLHGGATLRFRLDRDGSASVLGSLRVRTGKARALPRACRRLATGTGR